MAEDKGLVFADYEGGSIANLMPSLVYLLTEQKDIWHFPARPLRKEYVEWLNSEVEKIVLFIIDGLGYQLLQEYIAENPDSFFASFEREGHLLKMTSVVPSTTVAAMSSIWNGASPTQHTIAGYEIFMREIGCPVNMLKFSPSHIDSPGLAESMGLAPEKLVPFTCVDEGRRDVNIISLLYNFIVDSPLSRVIHQIATRKIGIVNLRDELFWVQELLEKENGKSIIVAYWSDLDALSHHYGPAHRVWRDEMEVIAHGMEKLVKTLNKETKRKTLFIITADHGFCCSPGSQSVDIRKIDGLFDNFVVEPTGETRFVYLTIRHGKLEATLDTLRSRLGEDFWVVPSEDAYQAGIFGVPTDNAFRRRIGDIIVTPYGSKNIVWKENGQIKLIGRHGGMTPMEMWVPFLAAVFE